MDFMDVPKNRRTHDAVLFIMCRLCIMPKFSISRKPVLPKTLPDVLGRILPILWRQSCLD